MKKHVRKRPKRRDLVRRSAKKPAHGAQKALRNYGKPKIPVFLMGGEDCTEWTNLLRNKCHSPSQVIRSIRTSSVRPISSNGTHPCHPQGSFARAQGKTPCARSSRMCSCNLPSRRSRSSTSRNRSSIRFRPSVASSTPRSGIHKMSRPRW